MLKYFDERAATYSQNSLKGLWGLIKQQEINAVDELLKPEIGSSMLDLGCGPGIYAQHFISRYQLKVLGVDSSPKMIEAAREKNNDAEFQLVDVNNCPHLGMFQNILAIGLMEFINNPQELFKRLSAMLLPGGRLVILIPNQGLSGLVYKCCHDISGCPTTIRSTNDYLKAAKEAGLDLFSKRRPAFLSTALCFTRME